MSIERVENELLEASCGLGIGDELLAGAVLSGTRLVFTQRQDRASKHTSDYKSHT